MLARVKGDFVWYSDETFSGADRARVRGWRLGLRRENYCSS
jgi:hypothetical protein